MIRKVSLINSVYTYTNNSTFTAGFDHPTADFNTKSSNPHVAVSQVRAVFMIKFMQTARKLDRISQLAMPFNRTSAVFDVRILFSYFR